MYVSSFDAVVQTFKNHRFLERFNVVPDHQPRYVCGPLLTEVVAIRLNQEDYYLDTNTPHRNTLELERLRGTLWYPFKRSVGQTDHC
jgi:hypothetical protein